jgi:predicted RNA binding protein YcfA (HicA-like mRNA interferase family)
MPPKVRELERRLKKAGFVKRRKRGKGSHRWYEHPDLPGVVVNISGQPGDDSKPFQEDEVREALIALYEQSRSSND